MKKRFYIAVAIVVVVLIAGFTMFKLGVFDKPEDKINTTNTDATKFKKEYESLNNKEASNGNKYRNISIPEDNPMIYATAAEIMEMINNKDTFAIYFGFKSCPWCRSMLPTLIKVADDLKIKKIYYVDVSEIRDTYELNEKNKAVRTQEGSKEYYQLLEALDNVLSDYTLTNSKGKTVKTGEKRIYAPNVVSIVDGKAYKLTEGISSKQNDAYMELTDEMLTEMYDSLKCTLDCLNKADVCGVKC